MGRPKNEAERIAFTIRITPEARRAVMVAAAERDKKPGALLEVIARHLEEMPLDKWIAEAGK